MNNICYLDTSKMKRVIYRPDMYNLKTRKSEKVQTVRIKLSINSKTERFQRLINA